MFIGHYGVSFAAKPVATCMPLWVATGAGAEMRIALGTAVFWGMIGVTLFGLIFTPVFYVVIRKLTGKKLVARGSATPATAPQPAE